MGLEAGTYVNSLDAANPPGTDSKSQGDDHLRLIKSVLKNTFPVAVGPLKFSSIAVGTDSGLNLVLFANSPSPLENDILGRVSFHGNDSVGNETDYADIYAAILDPNNVGPSEDGQLVMRVMVAGVVTNRIVLHSTGVTLTGALAIGGATTITGVTGITGNTTITGALNVSGKVSAADGSGIGALNASAITTGTLADARLPAIVTNIDDLRLGGSSILRFAVDTGLDTYFIGAGAGGGIRAIVNGVEMGRWSPTAFMVGKPAISLADPGVSIEPEGRLEVVRSNAAPVRIARNGTAGVLVAWVNDSVEIGYVSFDATNTVNYGGFCGTHWSQLFDNSKPAIYSGTVVESLDTICSWPGEPTETRLPKFKVSTTADSNAVMGVFQGWDDDTDALNIDATIATTGLTLVRMVSGSVVTKGDLVSSNGNGCAKKQTGSAMLASTLGKVMSNVSSTTYPDGSYLVPMALFCG